jgi:uncharacterized membrane protein AbrB (regulator of aidB expression)
MMPMVLFVTVLVVGLCGLIGVLLAEVSGASQIDAYLATSPGGLPVVLATATGIADDVTLVVAGQSARLLAALVLIPVGIRVVSAAATRRVRRV